MPRRHEDEVPQKRGGAELEVSRPILELAREIQKNVDAAAADASTDGALLMQAIEAVPQAEQQRLVRTVFARLAPIDQWAVLERVFGDEVLRTHLAAEHRAVLDHLARTATEHAYVLASRTSQQLELDAIAPGVELTLGLFLPTDVGAAVRRGRASAVCARRLAVRATDEQGVVHVLEDVFNPGRGLFVTPDYDESTWARDRLDDHARVRIGSVVDGPLLSMEPVLYPKGRVDVERDGLVHRGPLHLGFAVVGDEDVFAT